MLGSQLWISGKTSVFRLKKLYTELLEIDFLDEEEVRESDFINVFSLPDPRNSNNAIKFKGNNSEVAFFLQELSPFFENLKPAMIGDSQSFFSKQGTLITADAINTYTTRMKKKMKRKKQNIKEEFPVVLQRSENAYAFAKGISKAINGDSQYRWFLS